MAIYNQTVTAEGPDESAVTGYKGKSVAGASGDAFSGSKGCSIAGKNGLAKTGKNGLAKTGKNGLAKTGEGGSAAAGEGGMICIEYWDNDTFSFSLKAEHVGDNGILPDTLYKLNEDNEFVRTEECLKKRPPALECLKFPC